MKTRKPFSLSLHNSNTHSLEFAIDAIQEAMRTASGHGLTTDQLNESSELAASLHANGKAVIFKGTREACRKGANAIRNKGGDVQAANLVSSRPGFDKMNWTLPMRTTIKR